MLTVRLVRSAALNLAHAVATKSRALIAGLTFALPVSFPAPVGASPTTAPTRSEELTAAQSIRAEDLHGWEASLYRGAWWRAQYAEFRECVMRRESHFNFAAKNRTSSASGAINSSTSGGDEAWCT